MALKTYRNLANGLKLNVGWFQGYIVKFIEVTRENMERGLFGYPFNTFVTSIKT